MNRHAFLLLIVLALALVGCDGAARSAPLPTTVPGTPSLSTVAAPQPTADRPVAATPTVAATAAAAASPTAVPTLAPTPVPAPRLRQLTSGGCCTGPVWSPDSRQVFYIDKPAENAPSGIYVVDVASPLAPKLFTERVAFYSADRQYITTLDAVYATIERVSDGQKFRIRTGGRNVMLSPDRKRVIWNESPQTFPSETRQTTVMGANIDGSDARPITTLLRGSASAWLDDNRLLMSARLSRDSQEVMLFAYSLLSGERTELARSERLRSTLVSPAGEWIVYTINFESDGQRNGTWLVRSDGAVRRKLNFFGAFQWRDTGRLVFAPLEPNAPAHAFHEYDAVKDAYRPLTNPATQPFKIANGDWVISPDGKKIVFLNAKDMNLWLWEFDI